MKKILHLTTLTGIITVFLLMGCGQDSKKHVKDANDNLKEAGENFQEAAIDAREEAKAKATANWQAFKNESDRSIAEMEMQANELKAKIAKADKNTKAKLNSDLERLEQKLNEQKVKLNQKNAEFETDIENFNESVETKNEQFIREFKHDMNGLGTGFKDLFKDNVN